MSGQDLKSMCRYNSFYLNPLKGGQFCSSIQNKMEERYQMLTLTFTFPHYNLDIAAEFNS